MEQESIQKWYPLLWNDLEAQTREKQQSRPGQTRQQDACRREWGRRKQRARKATQSMDSVLVGFGVAAGVGTGIGVVLGIGSSISSCITLGISIGTSYKCTRIESDTHM